MLDGLITKYLKYNTNSKHVFTSNKYIFLFSDVSSY